MREQGRLLGHIQRRVRTSLVFPLHFVSLRGNEVTVYTMTTVTTTETNVPD